MNLVKTSIARQQSLLRGDHAVQDGNRCQFQTKRTRLSQAYAVWLDTLSQWTVAATFTLKRHNERGTPSNQRILEDTARHFLKVLNTACFGASKAKRGYTVGCAASYGWGVYGLHPHLHFSLAAPAHLEQDRFVSLIKDVASRLFWIHRQHKITAYRDQGWCEYMVDHGTDNVILEMVRPSTPA